jgi:hypothetical protein
MNLKLLAKLVNPPRRAGTALAAVAFGRFFRLRRRISQMLMNVVSQILETSLRMRFTTAGSPQGF